MYAYQAASKERSEGRDNDKDFRMICPRNIRKISLRSHMVKGTVAARVYVADLFSGGIKKFVAEFLQRLLL